MAGGIFSCKAILAALFDRERTGKGRRIELSMFDGLLNLLTYMGTMWLTNGELPTPQIEPHDVAEAILEAATDPTRDKKVGTMATLNTAAAKLVPSLGDKLSGMQADRQQYDEPPRDPEGTLYRAGEEGRTHGTGPSRAAD